MPNKNVRRGPAAGGAPSDFTNRNVANDMYVDGLTNNFVVGQGTSGLLSSIFISDNATPQVIAASGAIAITPSFSVITLGSAAALTLAAPTAAQAGTRLTITSRTAFAHVITATGLLKTGTAAVNTATFGAFPGASITLVADNLLWNVLSSNAITFG